MKDAIKLLHESLNSEKLISIIFSSPKEKNSELKNIVINSTKVKNELKLELRFKKHNDIKSISIDNIRKDVELYILDFKQCLIKTEDQTHQVLVNKKLKPKIISKTITSIKKESHNRNKNYLIPDGQKCDFLIEIGVMNESGQVKSNYYKKFKQINRFLEMVDDLYRNTNMQSLHIVDFGCGKSYLTFAIYYYFHEVLNIPAQITGVDLKQEVIDHCNSIATKLKYDKLKFVHGFIHSFKTDKPIDFVFTLHACDTATDDAILFSLKNKAEKMMFVPCCQHELNKQLNNDESHIMIKHGIFRDRLTSIITDTMRSQLLESVGYKVQTLEFIDMEHTAKNILLRCVKINKKEEQKEKELLKYYQFKDQWNINPYLEQKLKEHKFI